MDSQTNLALCHMINDNALMIAFAAIIIASLYAVFGGEGGTYYE